MLVRKERSEKRFKISETSKKEITQDKSFIKIFRANTIRGDATHYYDDFEIPVGHSTTVLDALLYIKEYVDSSLCIRYSCRMASCGSCGMKINGIPRLACYTTISELQDNGNNKTITCQPLSNFPHIRDLVTDFSQFFSHHKNMKPYIHNTYADIRLQDNKTLREFKQTPEGVEKYLQFSYCIKCGLCYSACPTNGEDLKFPGPQALAQAYRYVEDSRDTAMKERLDIVDNKHGIWRCHFAGSCSVVCPKGVDPALGIQLLKGYLLGSSKNEKKVASLIDK